MDEITAALIHRTLDGLNQRYLYTAQNIANANSEAYQPVRVSFEDTLRAAANEGSVQDIREARIGVAPTGEDLRLDLELARASQTAMRYSALIELLGRQMALHRSVVSQGGR